ncbi:uncharacterized protein LOC128345790 isoform X1 [Hemicordylus capensis]|uniref:uncharacterized protein LOC128345790 isoform X1 n=1 Tax=Hemicordylus capensis TaxID=884348 RepID=UPI002303A583|nr:uncharacterized protein LOC128345790 isoform X1 [Hemicordylus capensis]
MGKRERRRLCEVVTFCCSVILLLTFLGLFMWQALGLRTCRAQLQNQTAQDQDPEVASFRKDRAELEAAEARAKEEGARLRAELGATNRSLGQAQQGWDTCRKQLNTLQENITSQKEESTQCETENHKFQGNLHKNIRTVQHPVSPSGPLPCSAFLLSSALQKSASPPETAVKEHTYRKSNASSRRFPPNRSSWKLPSSNGSKTKPQSGICRSS